jgi:hypothetical protein
MRLGASYNVFDGEELLENSIRYIKEQVDYVSVVYQEISNFGDKCSDSLLNLLDKLVNKKHINELYKYTPEIHNEITDRNHDQEIEHRNIGLELSRKNGCTHHMSLDVDEFYVDIELAYAKKIIEEGGYDASAWMHLQYYKDSIYLIYPPEIEFVGGIYELTPDTKFVFSGGYPPTDPTRKTNNQDYKIFSRKEIQMHHMSFVRKDIRKKYMNHTSRADIIKNIDKIVDYYNNWEYPAPAMWAGGNLVKVIKIDRMFDVYGEEYK